MAKEDRHKNSLCGFIDDGETIAAAQRKTVVQKNAQLELFWHR